MRKKVCAWISMVGAVLAGLLVAAALIWKSLPADTSVPGLAGSFLVASNSPAPGRGVTVPWYIRSGQWQADMRSLEAILRYLTDSEVIAQTNSMPTKADDA